MQTTARTIIKKSLRLIGAISSDEEPTNGEISDCFDSLRTMVDSWGIEKMMAGNELLFVHPVSSGAQSFTSGPSGNHVVSPAPNYVNYVFASNGDINYEITVVDSREEFDGIKATNPVGWPTAAYYSSHIEGTSEGKLEFSSQFPENTSISFGVSACSGNFSGLDTATNLPAGLKRALETNLAIEMAPEFQIQPSEALIRSAIASKTAFKIKNLEVPKLSYPYEVQDGFDIVSG